MKIEIKEVLKGLPFDKQQEWICSLSSKGLISTEDYNELYNYFLLKENLRKEELYETICKIPLSYRKEKLFELLYEGKINGIDYVVLTKQSLTGNSSSLVECLISIAKDSKEFNFLSLITTLMLEGRVTEVEFSKLSKWYYGNESNR